MEPSTSICILLSLWTLFILFITISYIKRKPLPNKSKDYWKYYERLDGSGIITLKQITQSINENNTLVISKSQFNDDIVNILLIRGYEVVTQGENFVIKN